MKHLQLSKIERKATFALASIFSLRMLGLFMILPGFSLYASGLPGVTPSLIGLALGIYGITSGILQIPVGLLSDRIGRKPTIILGLLIFAFGSILAAKSTSIEGIIIGRALQGIGAVGGAVLALATDLTHEEVRTKTMGMIGITIGFSFTLAMVLGPIFTSLWGISGIFWFIAWMSIIAIIVVLLIIPSPPRIRSHLDQGVIPSYINTLMCRPELLRLNTCVLLLHAMLTAVFVVLPITLTHQANLAITHQWVLYLPVLIIAFVASFPLIIIAEAKQKMKQVLILAALLLIIACSMLRMGYQSIPITAIALLAFFLAFSTLEACLPSAVSKLAPITGRGTAMGLFSSSQFFGAFIGGSVGGILYGSHDLAGVFIFCIALAIILLILIAVMPALPQYSSRAMNVGKQSRNTAIMLEKKIRNIPGIVEAAIIAEEGVAYMKVIRKKLDEEQLAQYAQNKGE